MMVIWSLHSSSLLHQQANLERAENFARTARLPNWPLGLS